MRQQRKSLWWQQLEQVLEQQPSGQVLERLSEQELLLVLP